AFQTPAYLSKIPPKPRRKVSSPHADCFHIGWQNIPSRQKMQAGFVGKLSEQFEILMLNHHIVGQMAQPRMLKRGSHQSKMLKITSPSRCNQNRSLEATHERLPCFRSRHLDCQTRSLVLSLLRASLPEYRPLATWRIL